MGVKISELPQNTNPLLSDEGPLVNAGTTVRTSVSQMTEQAIGVGNVVHVGKNGDDGTGTGKPHNPYLTIKAALASITDASESKPYLVLVGPGNYTEDNPVVIPDWMAVQSSAGPGNTTVTAANGSVDIFQVGSFVWFEGFSVSGTTTAAGISVTGVGIAAIVNFLIRDCQTGIKVNNASIRVEIRNLLARTVGLATDRFIDVQAGIVVCHTITGIPGAEIGTLVYGEGTSSVLAFRGVSIGAGTITNAFEIVGGAVLDLHTVEVDGIDNVLVAASGGEIRAGGVFCHDINQWAVWQKDASSKIILLSAEMQPEQVSAVDWDNVQLTFTSDTPGDPAQHIVQELSVGMAEIGRETIMGEGDSTTRGQMVYKWTQTTLNLEDVSEEMASATGSTVDFGAAVDDALYIGWDLERSSVKLQFYGVKVDMVTNQDYDYTNGDVVFEYWNGSSWATLRAMITGANSPYYQYLPGTTPDGTVIQVRFDQEDLRTNWVANDPISSGTTRYWVRRRIVNAQSNPMTLERVKIHTNRREVNSDGWAEYFGTARPLAAMNWNIQQSHPAGSSPADQDVYLSKVLDAGRVENLFVNSATDRLTFTSILPADFDTSGKLRFDIYYAVTAAGGGDMRWQWRWDISRDGDPIYFSSGSAPASSPNEQSLVVIDAVPANPNVQAHFEVTINVPVMASRYSDGKSPDLLWVSAEREGGHVDDTYGGNVALIDAVATYQKWCDGGHVV